MVRLFRNGVAGGTSGDVPDNGETLSPANPKDRALLRCIHTKAPRWGGFTEERKAVWVDVLDGLARNGDPDTAADAIKTLAVIDRMNQSDEHHRDKMDLAAKQQPGTTVNLTQNVIYLTPPADKVSECKRLEAIIGDGNAG